MVQSPDVEIEPESPEETEIILEILERESAEIRRIKERTEEARRELEDKLKILEPEFHSQLESGEFWFTVIPSKPPKGERK